MPEPAIAHVSGRRGSYIPYGFSYNVLTCSAVSPASKTNTLFTKPLKLRLKSLPTPPLDCPELPINKGCTEETILPVCAIYPVSFPSS